MSDEDGPQKPRRGRKWFAIVVEDIWTNHKVFQVGPLAKLLYVYALTKNAESIVNERDGTIPASQFEPGYVARLLDMTKEEVSAALEQCLGVRLLARATTVGGEEEIHIVGWSEEWKRVALTKAETERKRRYRAGKREASGDPEIRDPKKQRERAQTQKKKERSPGHVPDKSRTVCVYPPSPPSELELAAATTVTRALSSYTGLDKASTAEIRLIVDRLREGHTASGLTLLVQYSADDGGLGWWFKRDTDGRHHMRGNLTITHLMSRKHIEKYWTTATSRWDREGSPAELRAIGGS